MKKLTWLGLRLLLVLVLLLQTTAVALADDDYDEVELETKLTGAAEVDRTTGQLGAGDPDGKGKASISLENGFTELCFKIKVSKIDTVTAAHIHEAPAGVNGGVVVGFDLLPNPKVKGCIAIAADLGQKIAANPAQYYVNVHNAAFPGGAVRGQLEIDD